jgi:hypothetical protein
VTARNAEQKKPDLNGNLPLGIAPFRRGEWGNIEHSTLNSEHPLEDFWAKTPWGWKGSSIGDGRGTLGLQTRPNINSGGAAELA